MRNGWTCIAMGCALLMPAAGHALPQVYNFSGSLSQGDRSNTVLAVGDPFSGSFSIDPDQGPIHVTPGYQGYQVGVSVSLTLKNLYSFRTTGAGLGPEVRVTHDATLPFSRIVVDVPFQSIDGPALGDSVVDRSVIYGIRLTLDDPTGTALSSLDFPPSLVLSAYAVRTLSVEFMFTEPGMGGFQVQGELDSLVLASTSAVPEPATAILLAMGSVALGTVARRRHTKA